jgi:hypothetical protein
LVNIPIRVVEIVHWALLDRMTLSACGDAMHVCGVYWTMGDGSAERYLR